MIQFTCPTCGLALKAHNGAEGNRSRCPCGQPFIVPSDGIEAYAVGFRTTRPALRTEAEPLPSDDDMELESGLELARQKREQMHNLIRDRIRRAPHPFGLMALLLAFVSGLIFLLAANSDEFPFNGYVMPTFAFSLLAVCAGWMCHSLTFGVDRRATLGIVIGGLVFVVMAASFFGQVKSRQDVKRAIPQFLWE